MPDTHVSKVILTHRGAARTKYGAAGWTKIRSAVTRLVAADKARGIATRFVAVDSAATVRPLGVAKVDAPSDVAAIKAVVDAAVAKWQPAYVVLLGGPELLATVNLTNPLWTGDPADDPDQFVPSDLPYACDGALSFSPGDYRGPTRVVGRIADLVGDPDPAVLVGQLDAAAKGTSLHRAAPQPLFALSAKVWQRSTRLTVDGLAGVSGTVLTSPPSGPAWTAADLAPAVHLVNCHGSEFDPNWYGQLSPNNWNLPVAVAAAGLPGLVAPGTVVAAECCYGTSHWPPSAAHGQAGVALTYLRNGAVGVFGSSTVAYGPAASNDYADVICRLFLAEVLSGASLGRAVLAARQGFVQGQAFLDPTDLKTLAQFSLLGDPSVVPFVVGGAAAPKSRRMVAAPALTAEVNHRRAQFAAVGTTLATASLACTDRPRARSGLTPGALATLVGRDVPGAVTVRTFDTIGGVEPAAFARSPARPRAHVAFLPGAGRRPRSLVVVREPGGGAPEVREVVPR